MCLLTSSAGLSGRHPGSGVRAAENGGSTVSKTVSKRHLNVEILHRTTYAIPGENV
jgi:hypothetical protein